MNLLKNLTLQLLFTFGIIAAFGLAIWFLNKIFYKQIGRAGRTVCKVTGFLGTPVHELGHAFFCLLFGHKITAIKLYQPNNKDGVMGYVAHTYNKRNIYHQIGNFFISVGPILFGAAALLLLMLLFVHGLLGDLYKTMNLFKAEGNVFRVLWNILATFFGASSLANPWWWLFMLPACSVALHMVLSPADIKAGALGLAFITAIFLIINIIFSIINKKAMYALTNGCLYLCGFILNFLLISVFILLILITFTGIVKGLIRLIKHKKPLTSPNS